MHTTQHAHTTHPAQTPHASYTLRPFGTPLQSRQLVPSPPHTPHTSTAAPLPSTPSHPTGAHDEPVFARTCLSRTTHQSLTITIAHTTRIPVLAVPATARRHELADDVRARDIVALGVRAICRRIDSRRVSGLTESVLSHSIVHMRSFQPVHVPFRSRNTRHRSQTQSVSTNQATATSSHTADD
jgi:hypothetical protein